MKQALTILRAGNPASNPKERAFFEQASKVTLENAKLVAFGSTRYKNTDVKEDAGVAALMSANTPCVAIFGKSWDLHVTDVLGTTLDENNRYGSRYSALLQRPRQGSNI